jgi:hypothetical protein
MTMEIEQSQDLSRFTAEYFQQFRDGTHFTAEWFPYKYKRFERSDRVAAMSLADEGAYHKAIRVAWEVGTVPSDPKLLAAKIQKRCTEKIASVVLSMFEPVPGWKGRMYHPTVEEIRIVQAQKYANRVKGGKASAVNRGNKHTSSITEQCLSNAPAEPEQYSSSYLISQNKDLDLKRLMERVRENFPKTDERLVEIGVLHTLLQRNGSEDPIRSPRYFDPEIEKIVRDAAKLSSKAVDVMLESRRRKFFDANETKL